VKRNIRKIKDSQPVFLKGFSIATAMEFHSKFPKHRNRRKIENRGGEKRGKTRLILNLHSCGYWKFHSGKFGFSIASATEKSRRGGTGEKSG
jgi:hypothetical protein